MMQMEFFPMNAAELADRVVDVYKKSFGKQIVFAAVVSAVSLVAIFVLSIVLGVVFALFFISPGGVTAFERFIIAGILIGVVPFILLGRAFSGAGFILLSRQAFYGHTVRLKYMGLTKVAARAISAVFAQAVLSLPFIAAIIGVVYFAGRWLDGIKYFSFIGAFVFFALLLILVVGYIIFSHIFSLSVAVAVFERQFFFGTIRRSWLLVKPVFWRLLGIRIIWFFVGLGFSLSAQGILYFLEIAWNMFSGSVNIISGADSFVVFIVGFLGPMFVTVAVAPLGDIMQALIYFNQRMKNEGLDIEIRLEKLALSGRENT
ncbi:MAG: hypothetical protein FWF79_08575 [Defluviitaleaceae bacterium]|nr:hypothetical protein [Defluviitaleaceae bacterium]